MEKKKQHIWTKPISKIRTAAAIVICAILVIGLIIGNYYASRYAGLISVYLNTPTQKIVSEGEEQTDHYTTSFTSVSDKEEALADLGMQLEEEGIVLLENQDSTLPLATGAKVTLLGVASMDPVYSGGGAAAVNVDDAVDLKTGLESAGFEVNPVMAEFYDTGAGAAYKRAELSSMSGNIGVVNEVPATAYTNTQTESFVNYSDAAIVVIGREGSEQTDLTSTAGETGYTYLQMNDDEKALLAMAQDNFEQVVVVLNTSNPVELGVMEDYDIDACIWVGAIGTTGAYAVGDVLSGEVNPSGSLVDTYAYDSLSAPSMANFGNYSFSNSEEQFANNYMVYGEGIYVGYHYYETRYEDVVLGNEDVANYDYTTAVQYPFGYGLSYTEFDWTDYRVQESDNSYNVEVTVTNTGNAAGKDTVQIYMQSPYTEYDKEHAIEKSSVELAGFAKTEMLEPGASEKVTIVVNKEQMRTYDADGYGTYIVDAGDYLFAAGTNAHDALNNILAAKGYTTDNGMDVDGNADMVYTVTQNGLDADTYAVSASTDNAITNQFADADITYYDDSYTYLSRSDWSGTWPETYQNGSWEAPQELLDDMQLSYSEDQNADPVTDTIDEEAGELTVSMFMDSDSDNELLNKLVEQMSVSELDKLVRIGGYATQNIDSIQLPATVDKDGTAGITAGLVGGEDGAAYPTEIVIASTWNAELVETFGEYIGEDSIELGVTVWYAPACNIHRSPYSGRNFEYYSEDSFLSGVMAQSTVAGAQSKGVIPTVKHFAVNDQEQNRMGGAMFLNEQTIRELYLKPFEMAVRNSNALAMMASMNRIGARWTGGDAGLMTETLRNEWGFNGFVVTDQASYDVFAYEDLREGLEAGTDLWLNTDETLWKLSEDEMTPTVISNMQNAAKHIAYTISQSNAMNGLSNNSRIVSIMPIWQVVLIIVDVVVGALVLLTMVVVIMRLRQNKLQKKD
ncbi:MAG: glycoside hydrolase family 3 N-terminal domain-containing protein [Lachnospiraceae bacterium]|nr:glycoside hydrolase family 3 N-terminal domain-containing protein [Lachnospiraceae bacterium]